VASAKEKGMEQAMAKELAAELYLERKQKAEGTRQKAETE